MSVFARWFVVAFAVIVTPGAFAADVLDRFKFTESNYGIPGREFALAFVHDSGGDSALLGAVDDNSRQVSVQFSLEQWKVFRSMWRDARAALVTAVKQGSTDGIQPWVYLDGGGNRMSILVVDHPPSLSFLINQADGLNASFTVKSEETMTSMDAAVTAISKRFGL